MKKLLVAVSLIVGVASMAPAIADPSNAGSASAYGLSGSGLLQINPTPTVSVSQPSDSGQQRKVLVDLQVPPLAVSATAGVVAEAASEDRLDPVLDIQRDNNARGYARTEGLGVVLNTAGVDAVQSRLTQTLLSATAIEAEAVGRCVNGDPVYDTGYKAVGLKLAGKDLAVAEDLVRQLLGTLAPKGPLGSLVSVTQGEVGALPGGGVYVNGLHIRIPLLNQDIIVSRAEARLPADCAVSKPATPVPAQELALTGTDGYLMPMGLAMITCGTVMIVLMRRGRINWVDPRQS